MVAGRPSPAPLGPVYPAGSALGGGWGLLWPYGSRVFRWCLHAVDATGLSLCLYLNCAPEAGKESSGSLGLFLAFAAGVAAVPPPSGFECDVNPASEVTKRC